MSGKKSGKKTKRAPQIYLHTFTLDVRPGDWLGPAHIQLWRDTPGSRVGAPCGNLTEGAALDLAAQLVAAAQQLRAAEHGRRGALRIVHGEE